MPDISFYTQDSEGNVLDACLVKIYSIDGVTLHDYGTSDTDGFLLLDLAAGTYWVRCYKSEYAFNKRLKLTVSTEESIDLIGNNTVDYSPSGASEICRVSGVAYGASGEPVNYGHITFVLPEDNYRVNQSGILTSDTVRGSSDSFGRMSFELFRNATYECRYRGREDKSFLVTVPDSEVCKLSDLLFPVGTKVTSASTASGAVDDLIEIPAVFETSRPLSSDEILQDYFLVEGGASVFPDKITFSSTVAGTFTIKIYSKGKDISLLGATAKLLKTITVTVNA